jgi:hypothetical protein
MSTLPGLASKGEKSKQKFQSLDINSLYRVSRVSSLFCHSVNVSNEWGIFSRVKI